MRAWPKLHILPQWEDHRIADVDAYAVDEWLTALTFGQASKVRARNMMKRLFDLAMLWKWIPLGRNPMALVKVTLPPQNVSLSELF
jgi:hypothetical protein